MAEESEVWEEIRDALRQLAEQGEKQTALLKEMARGARLSRLAAILGTVAVAVIALYALALNVSAALDLEESKREWAFIFLSLAPLLFCLGGLALWFVWEWGRGFILNRLDDKGREIRIEPPGRAKGDGNNSDGAQTIQETHGERSRHPGNPYDRPFP